MLEDPAPSSEQELLKGSDADPRPRERGRGSPLGLMLKLLPRSRWGWAILGGLAAIVVGFAVTAAWWLSQRGQPDQAAAILQAVDKKDWTSVHQQAEVILRDVNASPEAVRAALFGQLVAYAAEADQESGKERRRLLLLAALAGEQAAGAGFPSGRESEGHFLLGRALHYLSRFAESRKYLREAAKLDPQLQSRVNWLMAESHLYDPQGNRREALRFNQAFLLSADLPADARNAGLLQQAKIHLALGDADAAEKVLQQVSDQTSNSLEGELLRGRIALHRLEQLGNSQQSDEGHAARYYEEARKQFEQIRSNQSADDSARARATYLLGATLAAVRDFDAARSVWSRCASEFAEFPEAWAARFRGAQIHHRLTKHDLAVDELIACVQQMDNSVRFINPWVTPEEIRRTIDDLWRDCLGRRLFSFCLKLTDAMFGVFPDSDVRSMRAQTYQTWAEVVEQEAASQSREQKEMTRSEARRYYRLAGDEWTWLARCRVGTRAYTEDLWQAGDCYYRGSCFSRASRVLREYLRHEPRRRNPQALLRLGECLLALGKPNDALLVLYECVEFHARDAASYRARLWAAAAHMEKMEFDRAEAVLIQNLSGELAPTSLEWRDSLFALGQLYFQIGRYPEAALRLEEAIRRYPSDPRVPEARYFLAEIHVNQAVGASERAQLQGTQLEQSARVREELLAALNEYRAVQAQLDDAWADGDLTPTQRKLIRNVYFGLGDVCYRLGRFGDAIAAYNVITNRFQIEPESLEAYCQIARCYQAMGRQQEARIALEQARIILNRLPQEVQPELTTPFSRVEWADRLTWWNQRF